MTTTLTLLKKGKTYLSTKENQKGIENHINIAFHLEVAAKHHMAAAKYHESGDHDKAAHSTFRAQGHLSLADEAHREDIKRHSLNKQALN